MFWSYIVNCEQLLASSQNVLQEKITLSVILSKQNVFVIASPAHHGQHLGIMTPSASALTYALGYRSITFEGMDQFHSKFTEG